MPPRRSALLTAALWRAALRRGLGLGLLAGVVFFALLLDWMRVIGSDAWLLLTLLCASWIALAGLGTALVTRLPVAPLWVAAAVGARRVAAGAACPSAASRGGTSPSPSPTPPSATGPPCGGTPLVTFAVALVGAAVVAAVLALRAARLAARTRLGGDRRPVGLRAAGTAGPDRAVTTVGGPASAMVAVVQGGTPQTGMGAMDVRRAVLDNHVGQTLVLAEAIAAGTAPQPDFVLWPENSSDIDPFADPSAADAITRARRGPSTPRSSSAP